MRAVIAEILDIFGTRQYEGEEQLVDEVDVDIEVLRERAEQMRRQEHPEVQTPPVEPENESATPSTPTPAPETAQPVQEPTSSASPETPATP